jgi:transcriptional regulator GlxA family with amidase domain
MTPHYFASLGVHEGRGQVHTGFLLQDTFAMMPFISSLEPMRAANRYSEKHLYSWQIFSETGQNVVGSNGLPMAVDDVFSDQWKLDRLIVCGPHDPKTLCAPDTLRALRRFCGRGVRIGALDTGCFMLARANLIGSRRCTVHWENMPGFRQEFPQLKVSSELFEIDGNLFTCSGGHAALDMMLTMVSEDHGHELASKAAELFIHRIIRNSNESQRMSVVERDGIFHPKLVSAIELMEANIDNPLRSEELANVVNLSKRQLERLFRAHLNATPTMHYQQIRLRAGHNLLLQTSLSVLEIADACGFSSADHFSKRFRAFFGHSPTELRQQHLVQRKR